MNYGTYGSLNLHSVRKFERALFSHFICFMKSLFLIFPLFFLVSCGVNSSQTLVTPTLSVSGEVQSVQSKQEPYKIGTVDTAFKLIGPDHKIEVG